MISERSDYDITLLVDKAVYLEFVGKKSYPEKYIADREDCWKSKCQEYGNRLWNGDVYTIDKIERKEKQKVCIITMGLCEYKDIVFKEKIGPENIMRIYGSDYLTKDAITTILPYTNDNKLIFGIVSSKTIQQSGALDQIGGTLNKNEKEICTVTDIESYTQMEVREELGLDPNEYSLRLHSLNYYKSDGRYRFLFIGKLPHDSNSYSKLRVNSELKEVKVMSKKDVIRYSGLCTNRIPFCQKYIDQIGNTLKIKF